MFIDDKKILHRFIGQKSSENNITILFFLILLLSLVKFIPTNAKPDLLLKSTLLNPKP